MRFARALGREGKLWKDAGWSAISDRQRWDRHSPETALPLAYDTLNDFATGFDRIDLDFITGAGLVAYAYAEVAIG